MRRRFQSKSYDEINITPLMDTVFFLLIIFMITAPLLSMFLIPAAFKLMWSYTNRKRNNAAQ